METRREQARKVRESAARIGENLPPVNHRSNGDEHRYRKGGDNKQPSYIANFTKGLPHDTNTGLLLNPPDYQQFVLGIQSADSRDFEKTPLGPADPPTEKGCLSKQKITCDTPPTNTTWESDVANNPSVLKSCGSTPKCPVTVRAWESQAAGLLLDLEGPDPHAVTMPPAPSLESKELTAEMAEVYLMALLRDTHFSQFRDSCLGKQHTADHGKDIQCKPHIDVKKATHILKKLDWFNCNCCDLDEDEQARQRTQDDLQCQTLFRGYATGDHDGPYLSQFLLIGNGGINSCDGAYNLKNKQNNPTESYVSYGALRIDQKVRFAEPCKDYMTTFEAWVDVQNGAKTNGLELYIDNPSNRYITTPRDLATYVHYDALYEAYLNACLIMLGMGVPTDPGIPFLAPDISDKQQGFASFGGPHILTLVTEVATRALKAVRYQKFNVHRRFRPEALAGLIDRYKNNRSKDVRKELMPVADMASELTKLGLLNLIKEHNKEQNEALDRVGDSSAKSDNYLLPMAFPEGSPMHPCYGAGHATVAGACVTILKAFFDTGFKFEDDKCNPIAYEPNADGSALEQLELEEALTIEGELNKLAANIAIGRDWAGVHFYTDYIESLRMGEQIAIGLLEEQKLCYNENFTMSIPLFDGGTIRI